MSEEGGRASSPGSALGFFSFFFGACRDFIFEQKSRHDDPYFVQEIHRNRHRTLGHRIPAASRTPQK